MKKIPTIFSLPIILMLMIGTDCKKKTPDLIQTDVPFHPLQNESDLDLLINDIGDARIVLLGEASHGTAEYYSWRSTISRRLIQEKGFDMIAVEGEWADSYRVNQFIKGPLQDSVQAAALLQQYDR